MRTPIVSGEVKSAIGYLELHGYTVTAPLGMRADVGLKEGMEFAKALRAANVYFGRDTLIDEMMAAQLRSYEAQLAAT